MENRQLMSRNIQTLVRSTAISFLVLGLALCGSPALANTLTRQDFNGNFTLVDSTSIADPFPESTEYSGFVTYDENNSLVDWEINVEELSLFLNPDSTDFGLTPDVTFDLSSQSNWDLRIDFGIAFDAPLYTLERDSTEINFSLASFGSFFNYVDSNASVEVTSTDTTIPEPSTIFASLAFLSTMTMLKKRLTKI